MNRIRNFLPLVALLVGAAILGAPARAPALFEITLTELNGASTVATQTVVDNGPGDSSNLVSGVINFSGTLGDFLVQGDFATSNSASGKLPAKLTINNTTITSLDNVGLAVGATRTILISVSDNGFTAPTAGVQAILGSQLSTTQQPTGTNVAFVSAINGNLGTQLSLSTVAGSIGSDTAIIPSGSSYTLSDLTTITVVGQGVAVPLTIQDTGITTVAVPAPSEVVLAFSALPCLGLGCWFRRWKKV